MKKYKVQLRHSIEKLIYSWKDFFSMFCYGGDERRMLNDFYFEARRKRKLEKLWQLLFVGNALERELIGGVWWDYVGFWSLDSGIMAHISGGYRILCDEALLGIWWNIGALRTFFFKVLVFFGNFQ